ncbi:MAG: ROK family transcriptional regulator [Blautia sp.]|nr:ROK family transcriptional regulator [Blautia sp.]
MPSKAGRNRSDYKKSNRGQVLRLIATGECWNRTQLTNAMGLTKMAISRIVAEMLEAGLVIEQETGPTDEPGRTPITLAISPSAPRVVGIVIQREYCEGVLCDLQMNILKKETIYYGEGLDDQQLVNHMFRILDTILYGEDNVAAIGASSIGPVSSSTGMILKPSYFFGISNVPVVKLLQERYQLPVYLDHDNQCAAICEFMYGNGRGFRDILLVGVGSGIGCGIISNGKRYRNERGLPPEIGHVSIDINGRQCYCGGRGCLETYARTPEVLKKLQYHTGKLLSFKTYCKMEGEPAVECILKDMVTQLAAAVVSVVNILNSELIVLGGDAVDWDERYVELMERIINERRFVEWGTPVIVRKAMYQQDAMVLGAASNACLQIFEGKLLFDD